jgi:hypothetical protein
MKETSFFQPKDGKLKIFCKNSLGHIYSVTITLSKQLTTVLKNGCLRTSRTLIRFSGSTTRHFRIKSFGSSTIFHQMYTLINNLFQNLFKSFLPEISDHSGDIKLYLPSMMFRNIIICLRCQKGGQPTRSVNIMTPQAHLK